MQHVELNRELSVTYDVAALAVELTEMAAADHKCAVRANSDDPADQLAWRRLTARHDDRLGDIMEEYGELTPLAGRVRWITAGPTCRRQ